MDELDSSNDMPTFDLSNAFEQNFDDVYGQDFLSNDASVDMAFNPTDQWDFGSTSTDATSSFNQNLQDIQNSIPQITTTGSDIGSGGSFFGNLLQSVTGIVGAVANYKRTQLPGGGYVYNPAMPYASGGIDPRTGLPIRSALPTVNVTGQRLQSMLSNPIVLVGLVGGAALLLSNNRSRR